MPSSCHFFWYFFSIAMRVSRFSVYGVGLLGMSAVEKGGGALTPFNSFVLETVTVSNAFTVESMLAMMIGIN
jgi:hypothetical protein